MNLRFVGQPQATGESLQDFLEAVLSDAQFTTFSMAVAWAKHSGLARVKPALEAFRSRGGSTSAIVGIDEGGATEQGLRLAIDLFDQVHVLHDPSRRTFHPKLYLAVGDDGAEVFIGSNNLTAGGLFFNYECGVALTLDLRTPSDAGLLVSIRAHLNEFYGDTAICKPLTNELLEKLISNPRYRIGDERKRRPSQHTPEGVEETDSEGDTTSDSGTDLFEPSSVPKKKGTPLLTPIPSSKVVEPPPPPTPPSPPIPGVIVVKRWFKEMSRSDAQRPSGVSHATGRTGLTKASHSIDQTTYFRHDFFGSAAWVVEAVDRGDKENATVPFEIVVDGSIVGTDLLGLDHATYRIADQGNTPTWLHWGKGLARQALTGSDRTGHFLTLEALSDGTYALHISSAPPGPFIA